MMGALTLPERPPPTNKGSVTDTAATSATGYEPDPRRWKALSVTLVAGFMSLLDVSIVAVALPSIQRGLGTSPAAVQWVVSGYALTFGLALVPAGRLGDAIGRRTMFLVALGGFVLCSAAAGAAPNTATLVAARLAQGIAAGSLAPQNSALIQQLFRDAERGPGVRLVRLHRRALDGRRPDRRRGDPRGGGRARRVALDLLRQRADRRRRPRARRAADPAGRAGPPAAGGPRGRGPARRRRAGVDAAAGAGRSGRPGPAVVAVPGGRGGAGRVRLVGAARRRARTAAAAGRPAAHRHPRLRLGHAASAPSTSSGSAGYGWCSPCTCSRGWGSRRCSRGFPSPRSRWVRRLRRSSAAASSRGGGGA